MKTQFCLLFLVLFALSANAQQVPTTKQTTDKPPTLQELEADPNVLWIGEVSVDYILDYNSETNTEENKSKLYEMGFASTSQSKIMKLCVPTGAKIEANAHQINQKIFGAGSAIECYENEALTQKITLEGVIEKAKNSVDTIITFDYKTYIQSIYFIEGELNPTSIFSYRLKQLLYYDKEVASFKTIPLAIAPLSSHFDEEGKFIASVPAFWLKPNYLEKLLNLDQPAISYAKRTFSVLDAKSVKVLKGDATIGELIVLMMEDVPSKMKTKHFGNVLTTDGYQGLEVEEMEVINSSVDTLLSFKPVTYEEILTEVPKKGLTPEYLTKIQLLQDWVWNEDTKQFGIRFIGFAPLMPSFEEEEKRLNYKPLFYRRPDMDKPNTK
mgnify:CR=1 FL=1